MIKVLRIAGLSLSLVAAPSADASEKTSHSYDALGRLTSVCQYSASGAQNSYAYERKYIYDDSGNRTRVVSRNLVVSILTGEKIYSPDQAHYLTMQGDGNFVLYGPLGAIWSTQTVGTGAIKAVLQNDGNLVLLDSSSSVVWASGTGGNPCARLQVQDDGNVVVYRIDDQTLWSTGTAGQ